MRIVIAEDSAVVRAGLAEILADSGHQVLAAVGRPYCLPPNFPSSSQMGSPAFTPSKNSGNDTPI